MRSSRLERVFISSCAAPATLLILLSLGVPALRGQGQASNATLSGTVTDQTGAAVPGVMVTLSNPEKGFNRSFTTQTDGGYVFPLIPAGEYVLRVEKSGFRPYEQRGIILAVAQSAHQDITLEVGEMTNEVNVVAAAPLLNASNANIASDVTGRQAVELPLSWRNVFLLTSLDSSVQNSNVQQVAGVGTNSGNAEQDGGLINVGGGRFGTTAFLLDGHWNAAGDWDAIIYAPSVDELQEFKVQTYAFTAQYGWSTGNFVNAITKSGTNTFHGNVYEFLRNDNLDANNFFNNKNGVLKPEFKRNQFGFTVGGPLYIPKLYPQKDKTFIFGAFEGLRQKNPFTFVTTVPTTGFRSGDFSALLGGPLGTDALGRPVLSGQLYNPFTTRAITAGQVDAVTGRTAASSGFIRDPIAGNIIPSGMIDPVANSLLQYWPSPTNSDVSNNYAASAGLPLTSTRYTVRVDHNLSEKSRIFGRWSYEWLTRNQSGNFFGDDNPGGPGQKTPNNRWDAGLNYTRVFSPTLVMSITGGWSWWGEEFIPQGVGFNPSSVGLPSFLDAEPVFPGIGIAGTFGLGGGASTGPREVRTIAVDATKIHGVHTLNMGFMGVIFPLYSSSTSPANFGFDGRMTSGPDPTTGDPRTGYGFASFLLGTGSGGDKTITADGALMKKFFGWYFQDDWKATRKLTLNLGLRYDFQTAPTERFDRITRFEFNDENPISSAVGFTVPGHLVYVGDGNGRGVYKPQYTNFAPRIGLSYQLNDRLVLRGGFGMFYIPAIEMGDYHGLSLYGFSQTTPWVATLDGITPNDLLSNPFPGGLIQPVGKANGALTNVGLSTNAVEPTRPTSYVEQWTAGLEYGLGQNDKVDVTYIGNHGVKLIYGSFSGAVQANQLPPQALALGNGLLAPVTNPFFGTITSSACGLDQPTVPQGQLLRPFPQYCDVTNIQQPSGFSRYDALRVNYTHRWSSGLHLLASLTLSKFLDNSSGPETWATRGATAIVNSYNLAAEKALDYNDIPKSLVVSYVYELPFGRGKKFGNDTHPVVNAVLGGWQVSGISTFKDGFPLAIGALNNNSGSFGAGQRPNLAGDPHLANPTIDKWFDTSAFVQPAPFTFGNVPRTMPNLRGAGINNWDLAIQKWWEVREKVRMQFRGELFNAFNRTYLFTPDVFFGSPSFGQVSNAGPARSIQMGLKIYW